MSSTPSTEKKKKKKGDGVAQIDVEHLPTKCEALSSSTSTGGKIGNF
jgi:hypothetical protein